MKFAIAAACVLSSVLIGAHAMSYDEMEGLAAKCLSDVYCELEESQEVGNAILKGGPEYISSFMEWHETMTGYTGPVDDADYWPKYGKHWCSLTEEERAAMFHKISEAQYKFWSDHCADETSEECVKFNMVLAVINEKIPEYNAKGYCEGLLEHMPDMGGPMKNAGSAMSSVPSFG